MGLACLGLEIGTFCDSLYSVLLLSVILGLYFFGLALSRPQVRRPPWLRPLAPAPACRAPHGLAVP
jgi:hypothetical protein